MQKPAPAKMNIKLQNPGLVTFCDIPPRNGTILFLQSRSLARGFESAKTEWNNHGLCDENTTVHSAI